MIGLKIMLVDDEPSLCSALGMIMEDAGYAYCFAQDGLAGLELFEKEHPDLVILDVMLPKLDGFEVCGRIRSLDAAVPILMLSAKGDIVDKKVGFRLGADDYLTKPFIEEELLLRIEALLRRTAVASAASIGEEEPRIIEVMGDLTIDLERYEAAVAGEVASLTPKEFQIVALMARHPGKVFTREDIVEQVWGGEYQDNTVSIPVYIRRIREKLEQDPSSPRYLQTVWRFGYRLGD